MRTESEHRAFRDGICLAALVTHIAILETQQLDKSGTLILDSTKCIALELLDGDESKLAEMVAYARDGFVKASVSIAKQYLERTIEKGGEG